MVGRGCQSPKTHIQTKEKGQKKNEKTKKRKEKKKKKKVITLKKVLNCY